MQYRNFGRLDWKVSALGFGCMRLPTVNGDPARIDEPEATRMLHYAIDHGVNYIDTAYPYHGGNSERLVGRALRGGYRDKVRLATKLPCWQVATAADFDRFFNEQLERLQTERIDFYLLHSLSERTWHKVRDLGVLEWLEKRLADGRVGHVGFSFHDKYPVFQEIIDSFDRWTFCQIQYNYLDVQGQAGTKGLKYAAAKGLAVVVMEPLLGGRLANPPAQVRALWESAAVQRTPADWALQWLWSQPEVSVVLSGMSTMKQVEENVASADASRVGLLTPEELELIARVRAQYQALSPIPCTKCEYCQPCPNGVKIPQLFEMYNSAIVSNQMDQARRQYARVPAEERADSCTQCRQCEDVCPQHIEVSDWLMRVHEALSGSEGSHTPPSPRPVQEGR